MGLFPQLLWIAFKNLFKSRRRLATENLVLRHQLNLAKRRLRKRIRLRGADRALFVWVYRRCPDVLTAVAIVRPKTIIRWHRMGFHAYWRWKSKNCGGRPRIERELRNLIRRMCAENPLWGAPRIHGELLKLGFTMAQSTVAKYMLRRSTIGGGQSWKTFLHNQAESIASVDLFTVPTIWFEQLYAIVVLNHARRMIVCLTVTDHPTAIWLAQQITEAFPWDSAPRFLIRDNDVKCGVAFKRRVNAMGIRDHPTSFRSPWQNGYCERVIGTIRRECLDHIIVVNEAHLRRVLSAYARYDNGARTHRSLAKDAPIHRPVARLGTIHAHPVLGGLHHQYARIE
jgi:transposase InsO family protein